MHAHPAGRQLGLYQVLVLQTGSLPLRPDGTITSVPHACTATLVWREDESPTPGNSVVIDPAFNAAGWRQAEAAIQQRGGGMESIGQFFETHGHADHVFEVLDSRARAAADALGWRAARAPARLAEPIGWPGISALPCPGHAPDLRALEVPTGDGRVAIAGDAILDREWLLAWEVYWPNGYGVEEIVETWRSLAALLERAEIVVPGHGPPIRIDAELLENLLASFPVAAHSADCPDVPIRLRRRLSEFTAARGS